MNREAIGRLVGSMFFRVFVLLAILYTLYHCVAASDARLTTAVVTVGSECELTEGEAVIVRDEQILTVPGNGLLLSYPIENGTKVSAKTALASVYGAALDAETAATLQQSLHALDSQLIAARKSEQHSMSSDTLAMLSDIQADIRAAIIRCNTAATGGTALQSIVGEYGPLLQNLNRYTALTGTTATQSPSAALEARRSALLAPYVRSARTLTISDLLPATQTEFGNVWQTGYFYHASRVDGYETVFNRADLATMNIVTYDALMQAAPRTYGNADTVLGKLVTDYRWSILLPVAYDLADCLTIGEQYTVRFPLEQNAEFSMTLERVIRSVGDGRAILILTEETLPESFRHIRFQTARLELSETTGYRIPDTALQTVDGREGVYILEGGCVYFRAIRPVKRGEGYVLAAIPPSDTEEAEAQGFPSDYLSLYDVVITSGKDLYDGKYIN